MKHLCVGLALVVAALLVLGGFLVAQDAKKSTEAPARLRGQLPTHWARLGLTDKQRADTYAIQARYDKDVEALQAQIRDLRAKEKSELDGILSADQKKRLRELVTEKIPGAGEPKKPDEVKKP